MGETCCRLSFVFKFFPVVKYPLPKTDVIFTRLKKPFRKFAERLFGVTPLYFTMKITATVPGPQWDVIVHPAVISIMSALGSLFLMSFTSF